MPSFSDHDEIIRVVGELRALRILIDERFVAHKLALDKAEQALNLRLERMNEFRDQIGQERLTYVRKDNLDNLTEILRVETQKDLKAIDARLIKLESGQNYNRGRDNTYGIIVVGAIAAAAVIIEIAKAFLGH